MPSQTISCLTKTDIEMRVSEAQDKAARDQYALALKVMQDRFDQLVKATLAGESVIVHDQWGVSVLLEMSKSDQSA